MAWNFSNGLLGMGGLSGGQANMPANSLLGQFYDPAEMRKYQLKQMLLGLGAGLMAEKGFGKGAAMGLAAGDLAGRSYRENAMDAYKLKQEADNQAFNRQWMIDNRNYERGRDKKADAWTNTQNQHTLEQWQQEAEQKQAQKDYVTGWMNNANKQGANLLPQGVRDIARAGGVESVLSPTDEWRYNNAQPYVGAQDYGNAFNQIAGQPDIKAPQMQTIYTENGGEQKVEFKNGKWVPVGGSKAPSGGITVDKDGNVTIGGPGGKLTEGDKRARLLGNQVATQEPIILDTFDALSDPQNLAGTTVPGGRYIMTGNGKAAYDAISNIVGNWLYLVSGATATDDEVRKRTNEILPAYGDDARTISLKKARLQSYISGMKNAAGITGDPSASQNGSPDVDDLLKQYGGQ